MKYNSKVFLLAADLIEEDINSFCCSAIRYSTNKMEMYSDEFAYRELFHKYFKPENTGRDSTYFGSYLNREHRILALCLLAAMAESGDL